MNRSLVRRRLWAIYLVFYLVTIAVFSRMIPYYLNTPYQWGVIALLVGYLVLFSSEELVSRRLRGYIYLYYFLQLAILTGLLLFPSEDAPIDYYISLTLPLAGQAMWVFPAKTAKYWVAGICLFAFTSMNLYYGTWDGFGYGLTYVAGCILVSVLIATTLRADEARRESQALLAELQIANRKLQDYSLQVEELAAAQERNRLARELHDSVSQTIFSLTLTAQAARILLDRDPARVPGQLDHLQSLAQSAMTEMRTLIQHLRPPAVTADGLSAALRRHAAERKVRDGLVVDVHISGEDRLPQAVEESLFRTVQEALNNVVKHARTDCASVTLQIGSGTVSVSIEDQGAGFDPTSLRSVPGHMGLASMDERIRSLGGNLSVESAPGSGTRIRAENIPIRGVSGLQAGNNNQEGKDA